MSKNSDESLMGKSGSPKTGGRAKGTPNKSREKVETIALRLNVDPIEVLLMFAGNDFKGLGFKGPNRVLSRWSDGKPKKIEPVISLQQRLYAAKEAAQYLHPKLRSIEMTGAAGGPLEFYMSMSPEQREIARKQLEERLKKKPDDE